MALGPQAGTRACHGVLRESAGDVVAQCDEAFQGWHARVVVPVDEARPGREAFPDDRLGDAFLAGVVEVDGSAGSSRPGAYVVDARARVTLLGEEAGGCLQE